jgi:hypothetical protein
MAWTTPGTAVANNGLTAAFWNSNVRDNSLELAPFFAAWTTWTPSLTGITTGNGTVTAKYLQIGKMVQFRFKFQLGSTSAITGGPTITLPVAQASGAHLSFPVLYGDFGLRFHAGMSSTESGVISLFAINTGSAFAETAGISSTVPFTWTTNDSLVANGTYEAA